MPDIGDEASTADRLHQLRDQVTADEVTPSTVTDLWTVIETASGDTRISALDLLGDIATASPELVEPCAADLVELLADTQPTESGGTVAGHAMWVIAAVAETKPAVVEHDLDLLLTRIIDGSRLAKVSGCRALTHLTDLDESSTLAIADVLKRVLVETDDAHVGIAAATAVTLCPCEYPDDRFTDQYIQFRAGKLDPIVLQNDPAVGQQLYEILITAALHNPETIDYAPKAKRFLTSLHDRHSFDLDISRQTYRLALARIE